MKDLEQTKRNVKFISSLAVGFGVSKVVSDGVDAVAVIDNARDRLRVKIGGFALGMYVSSMVRTYVDASIDMGFDYIETVAKLWEDADAVLAADDPDAPADAESTAEEMPNTDNVETQE